MSLYLTQGYLTKGSKLPKTQFFRIMNPDLVHHGFQWRLGENVDSQLFMPTGTCKKGGLYFTTFRRLMDFFVISTVKLLDHWLAEVWVAPDEPVWSEEDKKWKAHKVTVMSLTRIGDLDEVTRLNMFWNDPIDVPQEKLWSYTLKWHPASLAMLEPEKETDELVMTALTRSSAALQCVHHQTFEVCRYAANFDRGVAEFVRDPDMRKRVREWILVNMNDDSDTTGESDEDE